jgi:hypothetical protein
MPSRRVVLDENIDVRFAREIPHHDISTVRDEGWTGVANGKLLRLIEAAEFEVFVTADRNLEYQQTLSSSHPKTGVFALGMVQVEGTERSVMGSVPPALLQIRSDHVICSDMRRSRRHSTSEVDPPAPCFVLRRERFSPA